MGVDGDLDCSIGSGGVSIVAYHFFDRMVEGDGTKQM